MAQLIYQDKRGASIVRYFHPADGDEAVRILSKLRCFAEVRLSSGEVVGRVEGKEHSARQWWWWVDMDALGAEA